VLINGEELTVWDRYTQWPPIMTGLEFLGILFFIYVFWEPLLLILGQVIRGLFHLIFTLLFLPFRKRRKRPKQVQKS